MGRFDLVSIFFQVCLALILEDCNFIMAKRSLALVCFSALLSILEVLVLCSFGGLVQTCKLGVKEVSGRRKPSMGSRFWGINQNLCFSASEDIEMLSEGL